jgi:hypothetical protein
MVSSPPKPRRAILGRVHAGGGPSKRRFTVQWKPWNAGAATPRGLLRAGSQTPAAAERPDLASGVHIRAAAVSAIVHGAETGAKLVEIEGTVRIEHGAFGMTLRCPTLPPAAGW